MTQVLPINVSKLIDDGPVRPVQVRLFVLCALCLIMDGFDVQAMGFVAPAVAEEWSIPVAQLGPVFGVGNLGVLIGALVFTMAADTLGRRPVLIGATLFFAVMSLVTARAASVEQLLVLRFVTGIGLGCIVPNATALIGEYSPRRLRVRLMMVITVGFTAGAAFGGFVAAWLIPEFGWRAVFYVGGIVPLAIGALMIVWLPESLPFMVLRNRPQGDVARHLVRLAPEAYVPGARIVVDEQTRRGVPVRHLFREGRTAGTLLLWVVNFMNIFVLYSLSNWLPSMIRQAGYPTSTSVLVGGAWLQTGGTLGTFA